MFVSHCTDLWGSLKTMAGFSSRAYGKDSIMFSVHLTFSASVESTSIGNSELNKFLGLKNIIF